MLPGQEGSGVRLQKGSDNQYVVGGARGKARGWGGGTSSAKAAIVNDVPRASRSAASAYFARMDVRRAPPRWRLRRRAAATAGGGNDVALVAARAGVGRSDES